MSNPGSSGRPDSLEEAQLLILGLQTQLADLQQAAAVANALAAHLAARRLAPEPVSELRSPGMAAEEPLATLDDEEAKHWSKALSAVLRYECAGEWIQKDALLERLHSSRRYGRLTSPGLFSILQTNNRFEFAMRPEAGPGSWESWHVRARPRPGADQERQAGANRRRR